MEYLELRQLPSVSSLQVSMISTLDPGSGEVSDAETETDLLHTEVALASTEATPEAVFMPTSGLNEDTLVAVGHEDEARNIPTETAPFLDTDTAFEGGEHIFKIEDSLSSTRTPDWLPLTLRLPYLSFVFALSLFLGVLVMFLTVTSYKNYGLGNDNDSFILFFGWRFSPTLIATIYAILVASILNDVRRTEIFARLAKPNGASGRYTLCQPSRFWWFDPSDALSKTKNQGVRSWVLFFASMLYIQALAISPLSAGLLSSEDTQIQHTTKFQRAKLAEPIMWQTDTEDLILFRTLSGAVMNQSTSAWLSKKYAVLPFWPLNSTGPFLGSTFNSTGSSFATTFNSNARQEQWESRTEAYNVQLDCLPITLADRYNLTTIDGEAPVRVDEDWNSKDTSLVLESAMAPHKQTVLELKSQDGCRITLFDYWMASWATEGGGQWSELPLLSDKLSFSSNLTEACGNRTLFFINTATNKPEPPEVRGRLCSSVIYSAIVNTTVLINESSTVISFDTGRFWHDRKPLDPAVYDSAQLGQLFFKSSWQNHFSNDPRFFGPLMSLAASSGYDNEASRMLADPALEDRATEFYQQYLGEMLLAALEPSLLENSELTSGTKASLARRILVNSGIGTALATLLLLSACCVAYVAYATNLRRRNLGLCQDPGSIASATSLILTDEKVRAGFEGTECSNQEDIMRRAREQTYNVNTGSLLLLDEGKASEANCLEGKKKDPRPAVIQAWVGGLLLSFLIALIATIAALYGVSCTAGIRQSTLVYQRKVTFLTESATLAPYSIVPTLLALVVKLWYAAVGDTLKMFQPYVSMVKVPAPASKSLLAEYANTPIALTPAKALKNSHWILALVGLGALATEIFTVGMSALWDREIRASYFSANLTRQLELRNVPYIYSPTYIPHQQDWNQGRDTIDIGDLYGIYDASVQNWLYAAEVELTQSALTPPWSKDTWSFLPLRLNDLQHIAAPFRSDAANAVGHTTMATFQTLALRGRLECRASEEASDKANWLTKIDFTDAGINHTQWNSSNKPPGLQYGYSLNYNASLGATYFDCCANVTDKVPGDAAIGFWTRRTNESSATMIARWIYGQPLDNVYQPYGSDHGLWIWPHEPRLLMMDCTPYVERAETNLTVEVDSGIVHSYDIMNTPETAIEAWTDRNLVHAPSADYHYDIGLYDPVINMTVSWGYLFWDALLNSGRVSGISDAYYNDDPEASSFTSAKPEDTSDSNYRFRIRGLNVDFMSYSMLVLANNSKEALLDPDTYMAFANRTFGTFFKHFVSNNVTGTLNAFQPIGEKLPWSLGAVINDTDLSLPAYTQGALALVNKTAPGSRNVTVIISVPVEQLVMSPVAVFLCLSILVILVIITIIMYTVNHKHYKVLPRNVDTLASTLAFVYGSEKLLAWVEDAPVTKPWYKALFERNSGYGDVLAKIGPFRGSDGTERWGIELVDVEDVESAESGDEGDVRVMDEERV